MCRYRCEISADAPKFAITYSEQRMTVVGEKNLEKYFFKFFVNFLKFSSISTPQSADNGPARNLH
jgi:hypothetical protein